MQLRSVAFCFRPSLCRRCRLADRGQSPSDDLREAARLGNCALGILAPLVVGPSPDQQDDEKDDEQN